MGILKKLKFSTTEALREATRSRFKKKGHYLSIQWVEKNDAKFSFAVSIPAKKVPTANKRNRLKRVIVEWLNNKNSKIRPGIIMFVGLFKVGSEEEIKDDLRDIIENNFYV